MPESPYALRTSCQVVAWPPFLEQGGNFSPLERGIVLAGWVLQR